LDLSNIEVLMVRRKDSLSYSEFIRGKYAPENTSYVRQLLENMTQPELASLKTQPFDTLWAKLWLHTDRHDQELSSARERFRSVHAVIQTATSVYTEPEWGFPKGRRYRSETDQQCAEREFYEETNIPRNSYILVKDVVFTETFTGTNGVHYEHKYFLAIPTRPIDLTQKFTLSQKREVSAVVWKTLNECRLCIRPHYMSERLELVKRVGDFVTSIEVPIPNVAEE
jgi:8-oxo-dGTP pyrophosphatase MutT (NUDIX family)